MALKYERTVIIGNIGTAVEISRSFFNDTGSKGRKIMYELEQGGLLNSRVISGRWVDVASFFTPRPGVVDIHSPSDAEARSCCISPIYPLYSGKLP